MDRTDSARPVNTSRAPDAPAFVQFPPLDSPPKEVAEWAVIFDVSPDAVNLWKVPAKNFGRCRMISPRDMWEFMPYGGDPPAAPPVPKKPKSPKRRR